MVTSRMIIISFDRIHFLNPHFHVMSSFHRFFLQTLSKMWLLLSVCTAEISQVSGSETPFFPSRFDKCNPAQLLQRSFSWPVILTILPLSTPSFTSYCFSDTSNTSCLASPSKPFHNPSPPHKWSLHAVKSSWHLLSIGTQNQPQSDF